MAIYESIVILDSLMAPKEIDSAIERFRGIVAEHKGKVLKEEKWGKRRLAYEIQKKQYGYYVSIEFEALGNVPAELEKEYNYNDKVIRFLTYRYNKHKLKLRAEEMEKENPAQASAPSPEPDKKPKEEVADVVEEKVSEAVQEEVVESPQEEAVTEVSQEETAAQGVPEAEADSAKEEGKEE